jgi:hypothetical protein
VDLVIDCNAYSAMTDASAIQSGIIADIGQAIDDQFANSMTWTAVSGVGITIQSRFPFYGCVCGDEVGVSCNSNNARPLSVCPIYHLCDGVTGNETSDPNLFHGGLGFEWIEGPCPGFVSPTPTPSSIPTPTASCPPPEFLLDGTLSPSDLLDFLRGVRNVAGVDLNCDGTVDHQDIFMLIKNW